jgi:protease-4
MNKFLQQTLASFIGSVTGIIFLIFLGSGSLILFFVGLILLEDKPQIEDQSALVFDLSSPIKDRESDLILESLLSPEDAESLTLRQVTEAIKKASKDQRITGLFLDGSKGKISTGYAYLTEIRSALETFKKTGKKIIAYNINYGEKDFFLSSVADTIIINPIGLVEINGFSSPQLFFAQALEKYGIGVQVIRVGKYKAAVEPFTRNNYSPENEQQTQELLTNLWSNYLADVSKNRKIKSEQIEVIANNNPILYPEEAKQLGLIDQIAHADEVNNYLQEITESKGQDSFKQISLKQYWEATEEINYQQNKIAILYVEGLIVTGKGGIEQVGSKYYAEQIKKIRKNEAIKAVILRINSPGGSAIASELILRELQLTAQEKPVIVSLGNVAASGGYWLATAGEKIFAEKATITGSIGVFGILLNLEELAENNGINYDVVKTDQFADLDTGFRAKTEAELNLYQENVDKIYNLFLEKVATSRNLNQAKVMAVAQGRVWSGEQAKKVGLIDEIGGLQASIDYTVDKLGLGDDWQIEEYPEKRTWETELTKKLLEAKLQQKINNPQMIAFALSQLQSELEIQEIIENPEQIYAILPFKIDIK